MTDPIPSFMIPGQWQRRRSSSPLQTTASRHRGNEAHLSPMEATKPDLIRTGSDRPSPEWPRWAELSLFVSLLFGGMLLMMWGITMANFP
jgi:hypothetical protein